MERLKRFVYGLMICTLILATTDNYNHLFTFLVEGLAEQNNNSFLFFPWTL